MIKTQNIISVVIETLYNTLLILSLSHSPHLFVNIISVRIINIDVAKLGCPPPTPQHTIPPLGVLQRVARPALHPDVGPVVAVAARPGVRLPAASLHILVSGFWFQSY